MCQQVITPDGRWLGSAAVIEAEPWGVQFTDGDVHPEALTDPLPWRDCCLCPVDVEAALDRAGVAYEVEFDGFITVTTNHPPRRNER